MITVNFEGGGHYHIISNGREEYRYKAYPPRHMDGHVKYFDRQWDAVNYAKRGELPRNTSGYRRVTL